MGVRKKGRLQLEIEVRGSSAHASTPSQGTDALYALSEVVKQLESYEPECDTSTKLDNIKNFPVEIHSSGVGDHIPTTREGGVCKPLLRPARAFKLRCHRNKKALPGSTSLS